MRQENLSDIPQYHWRRLVSSPLVTLIIATLLLTPSVVFVVLRAQTPGDRTQTQLEIHPDVPGGLVVVSLEDDPGGLRDGDIVVGIDGRSLDDWLAVSLRGRTVDISRDSTHEYAVVRDGSEMTVPVRWVAFPLLDGFLQNWSPYVFTVYLQLVSFIVFVRRPKLPAARQFFILSSTIVGSSIAFFLGVPISDLLNPLMAGLWLWCSIFLYGFVAAGYVHFALVFPRMSRFVRDRRWIIPLIYVGAWIPYAILVALGWSEAQGAVARLLLFIRGTAIMTLTAFPLGIGLSIYNYRFRLRASEKRQMRWLLWSTLIGTIPWLISGAVPSLFGQASHVANNIIGLTWCAIPTAFAIAILREGLFDIDVIIRRTLVYSALTGILALVYFSGVTLLQAAFVSLAGEESPLAVVSSTLAIAALFNPLRQRVQRFVDRRFYRSKYDAQQTLDDFAASARDEVDITRLEESLLHVVEQTMQPESISLWVRSDREGML